MTSCACGTSRRRAAARATVLYGMLFGSKRLATAAQNGGIEARFVQGALPTAPRAELRAHLPDSAALRQAADLLGRLQDWQNHAAALAYQGRMTRLLRLLIAQYQDMKRERGWLDMVDVEMAAKSLLTDAALAAWMSDWPRLAASASA